MRRATRHITVCLLLTLSLFISNWANAQQRPPVNVTTVMGLPYTPFINDYYAVNSSSLQANLLFNDLTEPSLDVYLHIRINSSKVKLESKQTFKPTARINLLPGQLKQIKGSDFAPYFNYQNLDITGTTVADLQRTGMLPEGNYNFCIEVREYNSGRTVSNLSCAFAVIQLQEPPLVLTPKDGSTETPRSPQNISFQWQLRTVPPGGYSNVEYILKLYEITDRKANPKNAVNNNQALKIYESPIAVQSSTFIYDISATLLEVGKRYAFTVQAKDKQGRATFKNDGISEVFWFRYGMSTDGVIELEKPKNEGGFSASENHTLVWGAPDNLEPNMSFKYRVKVVKLGNKTPKDAIVNNAAFYSYESQETTSNQDVYHTIPPNKLERMEDYAWQVEAVVANTTIAKSKIQTFSGPPLMEYFIAGNEKIKVIKTYNKDLNKLSGRGEVPYGENDGLVFEFKDIDLKTSGSDYVLERGTIVAPFINKPDPIEIKPEYKDNGSAYFQPDSVKLGTQKYYLGGKVTWNLPHAIKGKSKGVVTSNYVYLVYSNKKLIGSATLDGSNDYELMDPLNFRLNLFKDKSDFLISSNVFRFRLYGEVYIPKNVKSKDNNRVAFEFEDKRDLFYFNMERLIKDNNELPLVSKAKLYSVPKNWILDLSEKKSPDRFSSNKSWKGLYFKTFEVQYYTNVDESKQLTFDQKVTHPYDLSKDKAIEMWVDPKGLQAKVYRKIAADEDSKFNQFPATLKDFNIDVDNSVTTAEVTGSVLIPFISQTNAFDFTLPINNDGFQTGSLDKSLDGYEMVYNPEGGDQKMNLTIKRAVFADNERLDCTIDLEIPKLRVKFAAINNFRIYGDMFIGYSKRNGSYNLPKQKVGKFEGWTINIDKLGAGLVKGNYSMGYSGTLPMGKDVSGKTGPPRIDISSTAGISNVSEGVDLSSGDYASSKPEIPVKIKPDQKKDQFAFEPIEVKFRSAIVKVDGYLEVRQGDPTWGTCFKGGLNGSLLVPSKIDMGANMILGTKDKLKYWYFDAYFNDTEGQGVKVFNFFNIVALEGRVYRHMKQNMKTKEFEINKDVEFGAGIYTQLIDPAKGGRVFKSDIGAEIEVVKGDFTVQVEGDIAVFNTQGRDKAGAAALKKKAAKEMAKEAAKQAAKQLGEINVTVPVGSDKLKLRGSSTIAGMTYVSGSTEVGFLGDISSTPGANVWYKNGGDEISMGGNTSGAANFTLKKGSDQFKMNFDGSSKGSFDLAISSFNMGASFDNTQKAGSLKLGYDSKKMELKGNKSTGEGSLMLQYDPQKKFYAAINTSGKGNFRVNYDNFALSLAGDKTTGSGSIGFKLSNDSLYAAVDKSKKEGQLYTDISGNKIDAYANASGGRISLKKDSKSFLLEADRVAGTGKLELIPGSNEKYMVELEKSGKGNLLVQNSSLTLKLGADKTAGSGNFFLNTSGITLRGGADKSAGTGYAGYKNGSDSIYAEIVSASELKLASNFSNNSLAFAINKNGQGNAKFAGSGLTLYAGANKTEKSGYFGFKKNSDSLYTFVDGTKSKGIFYLALGSKLINAEAEAGAGKLKLADGSKTFDLSANINEGTGSLELKPSSTDRYYLALSKAGTGDLQIKRSDFELKLKGAKSAGSGDFYLSTSGKVFRGGADKSAGTGYAGYRSGSDSIFAAIKSASELQLNSNFSGNAIDFYINKNGQGNARFAGSGVTLYAGANKSNKSGYFGFKQNSDSLYTLVDGSKSKGVFYLALGSKLINAEAEAGAGKLKLADGSKTFDLNANINEGTGSLELKPSSSDRYYLALSKSGTGDLQIKRSDFELKLKGAKSAGSGDFYLSTSGKVFRGGADKPAGTGYAGYRSGSDSIFAAIKSANELQLNSNFSGNAIAFNINSSGQGNAKFSGSGITLYAGANKSAKSGYFGFKNNSDSLYTLVDGNASKGVFYLALGSKLINANAEAGAGTLKLADGSKSFNLTANINEGTGSLELKPSTSDRYFLALSKSGTGDLQIKKSDFELKLKGAKSAGSGDFYLNASGKIFRGGADKTAGTGYAAYRSGSDSVFANLESSKLQLKTAFSGTYVGIEADKSGKGLLDLSTGSTSLKMYGDVPGKSGSFALGASGKKFYLKGDVAGLTGSFGFKSGSDSVFAALTSSSAQYYMALSNVTLDVSGTTAGTATLKASASGRSLEIEGDVVQNKAALKYEESGLSLSLNSSKKEFDFKSGSTTVNIKAGSSIEFYENSTQVSINFQNGQGTFTKTYGNKSLEFTVNNNEKYVKIVNGSDYIELAFDNNYNGSGEFKYNGNTYKAEKDGSGNYLVQFNDKSAALKSDKSLELKDGTARAVKISKDNIDVKFDGYTMALDGTAKKLSYKDSQNEGHLSTSELYVKTGSKSLKLKDDKSLEYADGTSKSLKVNTTGVDFKYDNYTASFNSSKNLAFSDGTRSMAFSGSKLELTDGSNKLAVNADATDPSIELTDGSNTMKVNKQEASLVAGSNTLKFVKDNKLEVKYDKYALNVSKTAASYSDGKYAVNLGGDNLLKLAEGSKSFTVSNDQKVSYKDGTTTAITVAKGEVDFKYDKYTASFNSSKSLSFSDGTRSMAFVGSKLEVTDGSNKLAVNADASDPSIELTDGSNTMKVNKTEASLVAGSNTLKFVKDNKLEVKYDKYTLNVSKTAASYSDGKYAVNLGGDNLLKLAEGTKSFTVSNDQKVSYKDGTTTAITVAKGEVDFKYDKYTASFNSQKSLSFSDGTRSMAFVGSKLELKDGSNVLAVNADASNPYIELSDGSNAMKVNKQEASLVVGNNTLKFVKDNKLEVKYDKYNLAVTKSSASYSDGTYSVDLGGDQLLKLADQSKSFIVSNDQTVTYKDGTTTAISVSKEQLDFKYDKYKASFSKSKALSFTDGTRSFAFADKKVELSESSKKLTLNVDASNPSIELTDGTNKLAMSKQEAELVYGQNSLKIDKDAKMAVTYNGHKLEVDKEKATYSKGTLSAGIGGTDIVFVKDGTRSIALDKSKNLTVKDGKYAATIGSNKTFSATDGTHTVAFGGDNLIKYSKSDINLALYKAQGGYGLRSNYQSYKIAVEAGKGKAAKVIAENTSMGKLEFSGSSSGDLKVGYIKGQDDLFVDAGKKSFRVYGTMKDDILKSVTGTGGTAKDPTHIGGTAPPSMSGPQYLGDKITKGQGMIKGNVNMYYSSAKEHLIVRGAVSGAKPVCLNGAFFVESKKGNWKVMIGERNKLIELYPTCTGFGGEGYFYYDPKKVEFYVKAGYRMDERVGPSWGNIRAEAHANFSVGARAELSPFKMLEAEIGFSLGARLTVNYDFMIYSGSFEVASASLRGNLKADFQKSTLSGELDGHVRVCGFGKSFTVDFEEKI